MRLAITGGAGFLGYHLCQRLARSYDVIDIIDIADINPTEYPSNIQHHCVDIRKQEPLEAALKEADIVIHTTAALPLWPKADIISTNEGGMRNVLETALKLGISRVVAISSTAVYGIPEHHPINEDDKLIGVGPYGESKISAERLCGQYRQKGMCVPIVRPKTFIGTGRLGIFQILYDWVDSGKRIPIIGDGNNKYQLLEVEDLVAAIEILLTCDAQKANDTYNIGAIDFGTVNADVGALCQKAASGARPVTVPAMIAKPLLELFWYLKLSPVYKWVYGTADKDSYVSTEKAQNVLGWKAKYSNAQALIRSYEWYLEHKDELKDQAGLTHRKPWRQGVLSVIKKFS